jgi:hypothetical protein
VQQAATVMTLTHVVGVSHVPDQPPVSDALPAITASNGIELLEQIDRWLDRVLARHFRNPQSERVYLQAFKSCAGRSHPIFILMESRREDPELEGLTVEEMAARIADASDAEFRRTLGVSRALSYLEQALEGYYPEFEAPAALVESLARVEAEARNPATPLAIAEEAQAAANALRDELVALHDEHVGRTPMEQYKYIADHPTLSRHIRSIDQMTAMLKAEAKEQRELYGVGASEFHKLQFKSPADFKGLMWLRNYVLLSIGAINHQHVEAFNELRMIGSESPLQAFARVTREAELIRRAGVSGFIPEIALFNLITRPPTSEGHTFLTKALYDGIYPTV